MHDPDAPAIPGENIFGLPHGFADARIVLVPAPFDATCSYGRGTSRGPEAVRAASCQLDLLDRRFGAVHDAGIYMEPHPAEIAELSERVGQLVRPIALRGEAGPGDEATVREIDAAGDRVEAFVANRVRSVLSAGKIPGVVGGEHSVSLGAIGAVADRHPGVGVLQIDAHMDLRSAYMGFAHSHASVIRNVIEKTPTLGPVLQVGIRDFAAGEAAAAEELGVGVFYWDDLADSLLRGEAWVSIARRIVGELPEQVYVTFDIDGLEPSLCPNTGTPVPGGLSWDMASVLLHELAMSGRRVVGFDLVEVSPSSVANATPIDEIVGARLLYRLCGAAIGNA